MRLLHTADWHIGNVFHKHVRLDEHRHFFDWLIGRLEEHRPDALLVSGDVFDSPNPSAEAERLFYDVLRRATEAVPGLQVVVTSGNHDSAGRLDAPADFLKRENVYIRGLVRRDEADEPDFAHYMLPLSLHNSREAEVVVFAVPYLRPSDYPAGSTPAEGLRYFLDGIHRVYKKSDFNGLPLVCMAHCYAAGAEISALEHSERLVVGGQDIIEPAAFTASFSYVALGHIHKAQSVDTARHIHYAGSALPMSFTEKGYRHGCNLVTVEPDGKSSVERLAYLPQRSLVSIPAQGAASPEAVLREIEALPERSRHDNVAEYPYVEIRVLETQPEPGLLHRITAALGDRAACFCRVVRELPEDSRSTAASIASLEKLRRLSPLEMAQKVYRQRYGEPLPEPLEKRFLEAAGHCADLVN